MSKKNKDERYNSYIFLLSYFLLSFLIKIAVPIFIIFIDLKSILKYFSKKMVFFIYIW